MGISTLFSLFLIYFTQTTDTVFKFLNTVIRDLLGILNAFFTALISLRITKLLSSAL